MTNTESIEALKTIVQRLLKTCHYLESMNAYLLGRMSLTELRTYVSSVPSPNIRKEDIPEMIAVAKDSVGYELSDMDLSYMLGLPLEELEKVRDPD